METGILSRIKAIIKYYRLSERQFALSINITPTAVNTMFQRQQDNIKLNTIVAILKAYPDISLEWLVIGEGEMLKQKVVDDEVVTTLDSYTHMSEDLKTFRKMVDNLNDIVERQNKQIDNLTEALKNQRTAFVVDNAL